MRLRGRAADLAQLLEAGLVWVVLGLLRRIGPVAASNLGGFIARSIGPLLPVSHVAHVNLRLALPHLDEAARRRIVRAAWDNLGRTAAELPHVPHLPQSGSGPGWELVGESTLREQAARGGPCIFVSGHLGNWEMLPAVVSKHGLAMASMYRAATNRRIDEMIVGLRRQAADGVPLFSKGSAGAKAALAHLLRGGVLGFLLDQKMNDGVAVTLFGRPAMSAGAMAVMALRVRCPVIPGYVERIGPARFRLVCETPLPLPDTGDRQADVIALTQAVNDRLEAWITARPEGWLWMHRRWAKELYRRDPPAA